MKLLCKCAILVIAIIYLLQPFFPGDLSHFLFFNTLIVLASALPLQTKSFKQITLTFLGLGVLLLVYTQAAYNIWAQTTISMTNVIAILIVMQLFTIPIEVGRYSEVIEFWLNQSFAKESSLFLFTTLLTHLFASFLLFGTVPVMVSLFGQVLKNSVSNFERFTAAAISRGYALVVLWAPGAINVFLVLQVTGVDWMDLFVPGLLLSIIGLLLSYYFESKTALSKKPLPSKSSDSKLPMPEAKRKSLHIIAVVLGLVFGTVLFEKMQIGVSGNRIVLAGFIVSAIWTAYYARDPKLPETIKQYWDIGVLKAVDLAALFIAMGAFAGAIDHSGILLEIRPYLQQVANQVGILSLLLVPVIMIMMAVTGIHPFISIVLLGKLLTSLQLPISNISLALVLSLGGSISYILSPFGGIVLTLAKFINAKISDITLRWNFAFSMVYLLIGILFSYCWSLLV
ncbi:hypothetical protein [Sporomusa termitida]|uniref:Uncharacterized protein n=1 Tax=Sporomusa termitida TaxID=2377 RepID=A0A517DZ68_9FIRM|nr:hypothetical protein [Sporomusa termitida]QDR82655.1 hypothetical protein SPTER_40840 [Sporomusa termitida]